MAWRLIRSEPADVLAVASVSTFKRPRPDAAFALEEGLV
jgi:hypothetical protein